MNESSHAFAASPTASNDAHAPTPTPDLVRPAGVSVVVLLLSTALAVVTTAAAVLGVILLRGPGNPPHPPGGPPFGPPGGPPPPAEAQRAAAAEPFVQKDVVAPSVGHGQFTGVVFYPIPYAFTPHLTLGSMKGGAFQIEKQDELGFTWSTVRLDDGASFTWEAKGVRLDANAAAMRQSKQDGRFQPVAGEEGEVRFPTPFALPPNVEVECSAVNVLDHVIITECKATGFKWKHNDKSAVCFPVTWTAKGVKATALPKE